MKDVAFSKPVILHLPGMGDRKVATSFEAIECLQNEWPQWARRGSWHNAQSACSDALDGWCSAKMARRSFVKAANREELLLAGGEQAHRLGISRHLARQAWPHGAQ